MPHLKSASQFIPALFIALALVLIHACGKKHDSTQPAAPAGHDTTIAVVDTFTHYTKTVQPIIQKYCISCHGVGYAFPFNSYAQLKAEADNGALNDRLFVAKDMPPTGYARPTKAELNSIKKWISDGCKE